MLSVEGRRSKESERYLARRPGGNGVAELAHINLQDQLYNLSHSIFNESTVFTYLPIYYRNRNHYKAGLQLFIYLFILP